MIFIMLVVVVVVRKRNKRRGRIRVLVVVMMIPLLRLRFAMYLMKKVERKVLILLVYFVVLISMNGMTFVMFYLI